MKDYFEGKSPKDITAALPDGKVEFGDRWIQSKPFLDKKTGNRCFIKGKTDTVLGFNDNTYGVVEFKIIENPNFSIDGGFYDDPVKLDLSLSNNSFTNFTSNFSINLDCNSENSDNNNIFDESFD